MRRRRSSSRWSRKLMALRPSRKSSAGGSSAAISGIGSLGQRIRLGDGNLCWGWAAGSYGAHWRLVDRRQDGLAVVFQVELRDLGLDLRLEFVGGSFEFIERPPDLASDFRQLLWPEDDQGHQKEENHLWKTEIHDPMIPPERIASKFRTLTPRVPDRAVAIHTCGFKDSFPNRPVKPVHLRMRKGSANGLVSWPRLVTSGCPKGRVSGPGSMLYCALTRWPGCFYGPGEGKRRWFVVLIAHSFWLSSYLSLADFSGLSSGKRLIRRQPRAAMRTSATACVSSLRFMTS